MDVKQKITHVAIQHFAAKGYSATSIRDIVAEVGVSNPTLYYYFGSKEGLFEKVVEEAGRLFFEALEEGARGGTGLREKVEGVIRAYYRFATDNPSLCRLAYSMLFGPEGDHPHVNWEGICTREKEILMNLFTRARETGEIRASVAVEECIFITMAVANIGMIQMATGEIETLPPSLATRMADLILTGLGNRNETAGTAH